MFLCDHFIRFYQYFPQTLQNKTHLFINYQAHISTSTLDVTDRYRKLTDGHGKSARDVRLTTINVENPRTRWKFSGEQQRANAKITMKMELKINKTQQTRLQSILQLWKENAENSNHLQQILPNSRTAQMVIKNHPNMANCNKYIECYYGKLSVNANQSEKYF